MDVKIGLTGTPGTGKTTLSELLPYETIHLNEYMRENGIGTEMENGELEVDIEELKQNQPEASEENIMIEGHLSHFLDLDYCIVLRTEPQTLEERLNDRDYSENKIRENVESEALDVVLSQAVQNQDKVFEIDTTEKSPEEVKERIIEAIENREERKGTVDWTDYF